MARGLEAGKVVGDARKIFDRHRFEELGMGRWHVWTTLFDGVVQLSQQVAVVLPGQARHQRHAVAFRLGAMTARAVPQVHA
jgi:hypothetical protein